jgi:hypothetical protein
MVLSVLLGQSMLFHNLLKVFMALIVQIIVLLQSWHLCYPRFVCEDGGKVFLQNIHVQLQEKTTWCPEAKGLNLNGAVLNIICSSLTRCRPVLY